MWMSWPPLSGPEFAGMGYWLTRTKVGLATRCGSMWRPWATARTRVVLPEPSSPWRATTSPGRRSEARARPSAAVYSSDVLCLVIFTGDCRGTLSEEEIAEGAESAEGRGEGGEGKERRRA